MNPLYYTALIFPLLLMSCATVERDIRITVRDTQTKKYVSKGMLVIERSLLHPSIGGDYYEIKDDGTALIDMIEIGDWSINALVGGYDISHSWFSISKAGRWRPDEWKVMQSSRRIHPSFPLKKLEYRVETFDRDKVTPSSHKTDYILCKKLSDLKIGMKRSDVEEILAAVRIKYMAADKYNREYYTLQNGKYKIELSFDQKGPKPNPSDKLSNVHFDIYKKTIFGSSRIDCRCYGSDNSDD